MQSWKQLGETWILQTLKCFSLSLNSYQVEGRFEWHNKWLEMSWESSFNSAYKTTSQIQNLFQSFNTDFPAAFTLGMPPATVENKNNKQKSNTLSPTETESINQVGSLYSNLSYIIMIIKFSTKFKLTSYEVSLVFIYCMSSLQNQVQYERKRYIYNAVFVNLCLAH